MLYAIVDIYSDRFIVNRVSIQAIASNQWGIYKGIIFWQENF